MSKSDSYARTLIGIWTVEGVQLPAYETPGSVGMDLRARLSAPLTLQPMQRANILTGVHLAVPEGFEVQVRARSGLALKHGIAMVNGVGTIDQDYRGEVGAVLINLGAEPYTISNGDRIAQMVLAPVSRAELMQFDNVEELGTTSRGTCGFGSTGV